jgi:hypothetical protein
MKIFTLKNLSKLLEIGLQIFVFITLLSPGQGGQGDVSVTDRIDSLNKLQKWINLGNDPKDFKFDD